MFLSKMKLVKIYAVHMCILVEDCVGTKFYSVNISLNFACTFPVVKEEERFLSTILKVAQEFDSSTVKKFEYVLFYR